MAAVSGGRRGGGPVADGPRVAGPEDRAARCKDRRLATTVAARANRRECPDSHSDGPRSSIVCAVTPHSATARAAQTTLRRTAMALCRPARPSGASTISLRDGLGVPMKAVREGRAAARALRGIPALMSSVAGLHAELAGLRADLAGMPADSRRLADDVEVVHGDLTAMKDDLAETTASVAPVHRDLAKVQASLAPLPDQLEALLPKIDDLAGRVDEMRGELAGQVDGLRTDLSGLPFVSRS